MKMKFKDKEFWKKNIIGLTLRLTSHFGFFMVGVILLLQCISVMKADYSVATTMSILHLFSLLLILSVLMDISNLMFLNYVFPLKPCNDR